MWQQPMVAGRRRPVALPATRRCRDGGGFKLKSIHGTGGSIRREIDRDGREKEREREGKEEGEVGGAAHRAASWLVGSPTLRRSRGVTAGELAVVAHEP